MSALLVAVALAASPAATALSSHGIRVAAPGGAEVEVPPALMEELARGLEALPPRFRTPPGGELVLELDPRPSPFGMGDGTPGHPAWRDGHFVLYAFADSGEPRARFRLEALDAAARERLWRQRAIVHALISRWDQRLRWSARQRWHRITGWRGDRPSNEYEWAYSRRRGMASPSLDLVTFAEEALVPAESIDPSAVPLDDQLRCQEFSKARFLREVLGEGGDWWTPSAQCPAFSRWADLEHLTGVELLLSAPSSQKLQSLFGHLMLRPVYANAAGTTRRLDPIVEVAALTAPGEPLPVFIARGIAGGYLNAFDPLTPGAVRAQHVDREERNVRAYGLDLRPGERTRVMERLWEAERRGYYPYRFFSDNCATWVGFILNGALDEAHLADLPWPLVVPTVVVDSFHARREPSPFVSHRSVALEAERRQDAWVAKVAARVPGEAAAWRRYLSESRHGAPAVRYPAYQRLTALAERTVSAAPETAPWVMGIAEASVLQERYVAQSLRQRMDEIDLGRASLPPGVHLPTTGELVSERQRRYQRETGTDRLRESLSRSLRWASILERLPRRPATAEEERLGERAVLTVDTFLTLTGIYADLVERYGPAPKWSPGDEAPWPKQRSGYGRVAAGVGLEGAVGGKGAGQVVIRTAFGAERLGERRADGLDPLAELILLETELRLRPHWGLPSLDGMDFTLARLRTMPREPSITRAHGYGALGYGAGLRSRIGTDGHGEHTGWAEAIFPLWHAPEYQHHLVLGAGPAVRVGSGWLLPEDAAAGGRIELSGRAQLSSRVPVAARFSVSWTPAWRALGGARVWTNRARAEATLELARSPSSALQLELRVGSDWSWTGARLERTFGAALLVGTP